MSEIVEGKDVVVMVMVEDVPIAAGCATSVSFEFENEIIGKTDVNAGLFRKKRVRISDFRGSVQGLITLFNTTSILSCFYFLQEAVRRTEQTLRFIFTDQDGNDKMIQAKFLVQSEKLSGDSDGIAEFDLSLEGTGDLTIGDIPSPGDSDCPEAFSDWWTPSAAATSFTGAGTGGKSFVGKEIIEVTREMSGPLRPTSPLNGTPGDGEYSYDNTNIKIWALNSFDGTERVFVIWQTV